MKKTLTDMISENDSETVFAGLLEYNLACIEDKEPMDLGVYLRNDDGSLAAGLIGETHGNYLTVRYLWVCEELRGKGVGTQLLEDAEDEAARRGCKICFLDTFDFQAPQFYKKHGYEEVFCLEDYPLTGKRHYFVKRLK